MDDSAFWFVVGSFGGIGLGVLLGIVCTLGAQRMRRQRAEWWHDQAWGG